MAQLVAERGENTYTIEVRDSSGTAHKVSPNRINYLRKAMFKEIPLLQNIAVGKADNTVDLLFEKGMPLPLKKLRTYTQIVEVSKGDPLSAILIPLVEGSNDRADRNIEIGRLRISSEEVKRDVPAGSEVEFTLSIDQSNILTAMAYVPILDQEFPLSIDLQRPEIDKNLIKTEAKTEISRFKSIEEKAEMVNDTKAKAALTKIKSENLVGEVENALDLIDKGGDAEDMLLNRLRGLRIGIDEVESALEWPVLVKNAENNKENAEKLINGSDYADNSDKEFLSRLCKEHAYALEAEDPDLIRRVISELDDLYYSVARKDPGFWVTLFENIHSSRSDMTDQGLANDLIGQGRRSIDNNDVEGLRSAVRQLFRLLPRSEAEKISGLRGTVI